MSGASNVNPASGATPHDHSANKVEPPISPLTAAVKQVALEQNLVGHEEVGVPKKEAIPIDPERVVKGGYSNLPDALKEPEVGASGLRIKRRKPSTDESANTAKNAGEGGVVAGDAKAKFVGAVNVVRVANRFKATEAHLQNIRKAFQQGNGTIFTSDDGQQKAIITPGAVTVGPGFSFENLSEEAQRRILDTAGVDNFEEITLFVASEDDWNKTMRFIFDNLRVVQQNNAEDAEEAVDDKNTDFADLLKVKEKNSEKINKKESSQKNEKELEGSGQSTFAIDELKNQNSIQKERVKQRREKEAKREEIDIQKHEKQQEINKSEQNQNDINKSNA